MPIILSPEDPRIIPYKNLKKPKNDQNYFIAENEKVVRRLLESNLIKKSLLGTEEAIDRNLAFIQISNVPEEHIFTASKEMMESIAGFSIHRGIMAEGEIPMIYKPQEISKLVTKDQFPSPIIILNRIYDSENIGSIIRSARAFGIKTLVFDKRTSHPYLRRSVRVSMGNIFDMDIIYSEDLADAIQELSYLGYSVIGASLGGDGIRTESIYSYQFTEKWAIVLGNEAEGIESKYLIENNPGGCNNLISIPMDNGVDSLNVAHSLTAILSIWKTKTAS